MKAHNKEIRGIKVSAYSDADVWVVQAGDMLEQRFEKKNWTMKEAMEFAVDIAS